jgi:hypothetical protein
MDLRQYFVLLSRGGQHRISDEKINELLDNPLLPTPIGQCLMGLGYAQLPPTAQRLVSFYHRNPQTFAGEISIHGEWVKGTNVDGISVYLMGFTSDNVYVVVRPDMNRISIIMKRFPFTLRFNPDLETITHLRTILERESTQDTPEFCFFNQLLHFMDTHEEQKRLRDFKARLLVFYANIFRLILQSIVAFLNSHAENRIRGNETPIMTTDNNLFREMVKIMPIENGPLAPVDNLGVRKSSNRHRNHKNRKRIRKATPCKPKRRISMSF